MLVTRAMALDYAGANIRVDCLCPGSTRTAQTEKRGEDAADPAAVMAQLVAHHAMKRLTDPEDIAAACALFSHRTSLAAGKAVAVDLDGRVGYAMADDLVDDGPPAPRVALLPPLDPTTMGWKERDWYLGPHKRHVFDTNGNAGATIWCDGRIVGGWRQEKDGEVEVQLLEDVGREARLAVDAEAARLTGWLAGAWVQPRFPSPLCRV